jgi:Ser/Thr protein kinase RdoA (MazF antagonist)
LILTKVLNIDAAVRHFQFHGEFVEAHPYGSGHINDTYRIVFRRGSAKAFYILQRINLNVFKQPELLMDNIRRVTAHVDTLVAKESDSSRRTLRLIPTRDGHPWHVDAEDNHWRAYNFISGATTYDAIESAEQAFQAAKAFGRFQELLADLPAPRLHETIPDFHNTPKRFKALLDAIEADSVGRVDQARREIDFVLCRESIISVLLDADLPERVTHNDTKLNNVMLDDVTGEGICVIDLDTVMPGLSPYDFGDMVRTATSPVKEDERDLSKVTMRFEMFEALVAGYLSSAGGFLTATEKALLPFSGKLITFEIGVRFLTDYLTGDTYFKVHREGHNLDRCRTQFRLVESIERQEERMELLVRSIVS